MMKLLKLTKVILLVTKLSSKICALVIGIADEIGDIDEVNDFDLSSCRIAIL